MNARRRCGFTLIELVVTVAIVGVLAAMALPVSELAGKRARESELRAALRQIREGVDAYKRAVDEGRVAKRADASGYPERLEQLVEGVADAKDPKSARIHFLRRLPRDPFFPEATARAAETWGTRGYESPAEAPRPGNDVFDVHSLSEQVGLNGIAYREW